MKSVAIFMWVLSVIAVFVSLLFLLGGCENNFIPDEGEWLDAGTLVSIGKCSGRIDCMTVTTTTYLFSVYNPGIRNFELNVPVKVSSDKKYIHIINLGYFKIIR